MPTSTMYIRTETRQSQAVGLNLIEFADGDKVKYTTQLVLLHHAILTTVKAAATAAVKTVADIHPPGPVVDVLYEG